ncbi:MAG: CtsR family transcriptional regulator [Synergistaceae bacterium]|nr:CtsR family transcriptional regulator [Synergistaceae bacterium]
MLRETNLTREIEKHIQDLIQSGKEDRVQLQRKELAKFFGCVPSQINYVLRSRFTPERGFLVESQRGGHGYIRILRITFDSPEERLEHLEELVGDAVTEQECSRLLQIFQERKLITTRERLLIEVALRHAEEMGRSEFDLSQHKRNTIQAEMLKRMLRALILA